MKLKIATVIRTENDFRIGSNSFSTAGVGFSTPPYFRLPIDATSEEVVASILKALNANMRGIPHPTTLAPKENESAKAFGFTSAKERYKALECIVELEDDTLYFTPTKHVSGGVDQIPSLVENISINSSSKKIYDLLNLVFTNCS